jgi:hypothetical protein
MKNAAIRRMVMTATAVLMSAEAFAQVAAPALEAPFRKWDVIGGVGVRFGEEEDVVVPTGEWNAELGRYWTPHLKTSIALTTTGGGVYGGTYSAQTWTQTEKTPGPAGFAAAVAYQFLENVFAHPYVVAGLRMVSVSEISRTYSASRFEPLSTTTSPAHLEVRTILGGGFKSYFDNGRAFMRSELALAVGPQGTSHPVLRVGAGVDF